MKRIQLIVWGLMCTLGATAQQYYYGTVYPYPVESMPIDVYVQTPQMTWHAVGGIRADYGDPNFWQTVAPPSTGPALNIFADSINWGDSHVLNGPQNQTTFGISKNNEWLMLERKPWKKSFDTTFIKATLLGQSGSLYQFKFMNTMIHAKACKIVDRYTGIPTNIAVTGTTDYTFIVNPFDAANTSTKRQDRFYIVTSKYVGFVPPLPTVTPPPAAHPTNNVLTVFPNPVVRGTSFTIQCKEYTAGTVSFFGINGALVLQKPIKGKLVSIPVPSYLPAGMYTVVVIPAQGIKMVSRVVVTTQ